KATPWHRARHGFKREPDPRRAGEERLERPLRLHLLSPAVRVQPVWRPRTLRSASRQRSQRRWMGRCAQAGRGALPPGQRSHASISELTPPLQCPRSTSFWRRSGSNTRSGYRPTRFCRAGSAICSRAQSPAHHVRRSHASFSYQAGSWTKPRRVIAKVEWHPGELYPRVGFIVTNMSRPAERVVAFYNKRGTCEQWIKEGKGAIKWTRLSCRTFAANAVRLQLHALAYNLGNFLRTLATPEPIKEWSLTSLKDKLIKIGAKVVSHGRYVIFQMAEVAIARQMFEEILRLIAELRPQPPPALA